MNKNIKIILIILGILLISFLSFYFAKGATTTWETTYPVVSGEEITSETELPEYISYIFNFAFIVAGVLAFVLLIYGGFRYITSAGNPAIMKDAKDQIISVIIGIAVLLGSYLILIQINPGFADIHVEEMKKVTGIYLMNSANDKNKLYYARSTPVINSDFSFSQIEFINLKEELYSIFTFSEPYFQGTVAEIENKKENIEGTSISPISSGTKSIRFKWNLAGVYLKGSKLGDETRLIGNISDLANLYFRSGISEIELRNEKDESGNEITDYYAISHQFEDFAEGCQIFSESSKDIKIYPRSLTVFKRREYETPQVPTLDTPRVYLYPAPNYEEIKNDDGSTAVSKQVFPGETSSPTKIRNELLNKVRSIRVPTGFLVVLFKEKPEGGTNPYSFSRCQAFTGDNPDLEKQLIGQCGAVTVSGAYVWGKKPCATYISIYAIE